MVKQELCEKVVELRRLSDGVMNVLVIFDDVLMVICEYALQGERSLEEKWSFCELRGECDVHSAYYINMCLGDFDGHIGRHIDGFDEVRGEYGVDQRSFEVLCNCSLVLRMNYACQIYGL